MLCGTSTLYRLAPTDAKNVPKNQADLLIQIARLMIITLLPPTNGSELPFVGVLRIGQSRRAPDSIATMPLTTFSLPKSNQYDQKKLFLTKV